MFEYFDKIYIINLDKHKQRYLETQNELTKFGIKNYCRYQGVTVNNGQTVKDRERGCAESHFNIIKEAKVNHYKQILIFEDDIQIDEKLRNYDNIIKNFLNTNSWQMFYLGGNHLAKPNQVQSYIGKVIKTYTTHAYALHESSYDIILNLVNQDKQIDVIYADHIQVNYNCYCTIPRLITQREGMSYIQNLMRNYDIVLKDK